MKKMHGWRSYGAALIAAAALAFAGLGPAVPTAAVAEETVTDTTAAEATTAEDVTDTRAEDAGSNAEAGQDQVPELPTYELSVIAHCPQCGGAEHWLDWTDKASGKSYYSGSGVLASQLFGNADAQIKEFKSSDPDVVELFLDAYEGEQRLTVIARVPGSVTVTATSDDGLTNSFEVTVVDYSDDAKVLGAIEHYATITGVSLSQPADNQTFDLAELAAAGDAAFERDVVWSMEAVDAAGEPSDNVFHEFTLSSSDASVVQITSAGTLKVKGVGDATITVEIKDAAHGGATFTKSATVHVIDSSATDPEPDPDPTPAPDPDPAPDPAPAPEDKTEDVVVQSAAGATVTVSVPAADAEQLEVWQGLSFVTEHIGGDEMWNAWRALTGSVSGVQSGGYVYDLHLEDVRGNEYAVPADTRVTVTLPIPEGMGTNGVHVFHVAADGTVTDMGATVDARARTATFTTTHFSTFVIAQVSEKAAGAGTGTGTGATSATDTKAPKPEVPKGALPATGDAAAALPLVAATGAILVAAGVAIARRRRASR